MRRFAHDIELTKTNITRQMNEYISASNEMKNRSAADISVMPLKLAHFQKSLKISNL